MAGVYLTGVLVGVMVETQVRTTEPPQQIPSLPEMAGNLLPPDALVDRTYLDSVIEGLTPDPDITVSEWADKYRQLSSKSSAEHGPWRTSRTPYLQEIMDCLSPHHPCERVVLMKGGQIGGTEVGNNYVGYCMHLVPGPILYVQPTVEMAKRASRQRIDPMIADCPELSRLVGSSYSRDQSNTTLAKDFPGGLIVLTGANSAVGLRSMAARILIFDEVDAYPSDIDGEGDPLHLALVRARTFARKKIFQLSTPKLEGVSVIERDFEATDKRRYFVPCPNCQHQQVLVWDRFKWDKSELSKVWYECGECQYPIQNHQKQWMLANGEWRATAESSNPAWVGFHLPSYYSPVGWYDWEHMVRDWVSAQKSQERIKVFVNTVKGETWRVQGDVPEWEDLYRRRESYTPKTLPNGPVVLTAGVDVQPDRLEIEVVGWDRHFRSWSVDYRVLTGDVHQPEVWRKLDDLRMTKYQFAGGQPALGVRRTALDSGYATQEVYKYARERQSGELIVVKGDERKASPVGQPTYVDVKSKLVKNRQKTIRRGLPLYPVAVNMLKSELYGWLRIKPPLEKDEEPPAGFCHFPEYGPEYFKQLTAEQRVRVIKKGYTVYEWQKIRERNEALDARIYARAALYHLGADHWEDRHWTALEDELTMTEEQLRSRPRTVRKLTSSWMSR